MIRLVQISDTHISEYGQFIESVYDKAISKINKLQPSPDMVVHTGDITDHGVFADYKFFRSTWQLCGGKLVRNPWHRVGGSEGRISYIITWLFTAVHYIFFSNSLDFFSVMKRIRKF